MILLICLFHPWSKVLRTHLSWIYMAPYESLKLARSVIACLYVCYQTRRQGDS
ncbi:MAG: hypothetical protein HY401_09005 [Elusimicrobia bacterium]|nr:hypothetical protein [Elusimicrobiota bacterium]